MLGLDERKKQVDIFCWVLIYTHRKIAAAFVHSELLPGVSLSLVFKMSTLELPLMGSSIEPLKTGD